MQRSPTWVYASLCQPSTSVLHPEYGTMKRRKKKSTCFVPVADVLLFEDAEDVVGNEGSKKRNGKLTRAYSAADTSASSGCSSKNGNGKKHEKRRPTHWLYPGEDGRLNSKSGATLSWSKLRDSFLGVATPNDSNSNEDTLAPVCTVYMSNGTCHKLDRATFLALIAGAKRDGGLSSVVLMQACVGGKGSEQSLRCKTTYSKEIGSETTVVQGTPAASILDVETSLDGLTRDLVEQIEKSTGTQVFSFEVYYTSDKDGVMRVSQVDNIMTSAAKGERMNCLQQQRNENNDVSDSRTEGKSDDKPSLRKKKQRPDSKSKFVSSAPELPSLQRGVKTRSVAGRSRFSSKCLGDFCGLKVDKGHLGGSLNVLDLALDGSSSLSSVSSASQELERIRATSSSQLVRKRKQMTPGRWDTKSSAMCSKKSQTSENLYRVRQRAVLLARHQMHFVTGAIRQTDSSLCEESDFGNAWRELDEKLQFDLSVKHPDEFYQDTTVCADCFAVYNRLETLRENRFGSLATPHPNTDGAVNQIPETSTTIPPDLVLQQNKARAELSSAPDKLLDNRLEEAEKEADSEQIQVVEVKREKGIVEKKHTEENPPVIPQQQSSPQELFEKKTSKGSTAKYQAAAIKNQRNTGPSKAETEFLMRYADSLQEKQENTRLHAEQDRLRDELEGNEEKQRAQLEQIGLLQDNLQKLSSTMNTKTLELEGTQSKLSSTQNALVKSQRSFISAMKDKEDELERLQLEVEQARHAALASSSLSEPESTLTAKVAEGRKLRAAMQITINELNERVVELKSEIRRLRSESDQALKVSQRTAAQKLNAQVNSLKHENEKLSSENDAKQLVIRNLNSNLEVAASSEKELKRQVFQLGGEKTKLLEELAAASQSLKSITSIGDSENAAISAVRATAEAKVAHMQNELAYIKQQATSEAEGTAALKKVLLTQQEQMTQLVQQHKNDVLKLEAGNKAERREREEVFEKELQVPRSQIALLEEKVGALQANLARMHSEMEVAKRKLLLSEQDFRRAKQQSLRLESDKEELERNIAELQATLSMGSSGHNVDNADGGEGIEDNASKSEEYTLEAEAEAKRLNNRLEYLQKQLTVESTVKRELESALMQTREQLTKCTEDWKADVGAHESDFREKAQAFETKESELRQATMSAQNQATNLLTQVEDIKIAYAKAKDQLRIDQDALVASSQRIEDLKQELISSKRLAASLDGDTCKATEGYRATIASLERAIEEMEKQRALEVGSLKAKLAEAHSAASSANASILGFKDAMSSALATNNKDVGAKLLFAIFARKVKVSKARRFHSLVHHAAVVAVSRNAVTTLELNASDFRAQMAEKVKLVEQHAAEESAAEITECLAKARAAHEQKIKNISDAAAEQEKIALAKLVEECNAVAAQQLKEQAVLHETSISNTQQDGELKLKRLIAALNAEKQTIVKRGEHEKIAALSAASQEFETRLESELATVRDACEQQIATLKEQRDVEYALLKETLISDKQKALRGYMESAKQDTAATLAHMEKQKSDELASLRKELEDKHAKLMDEAKKATTAKIEQCSQELTSAHHQKMASQLAEMRTECDHQMAEVASKAGNHTSSLLADKDTHYRKVVDQLHQDYLSKLETQRSKLQKEALAAVSAARDSERAERTVALKTSTEKWQKILEECSNESIVEQERLVKEAAKEKANALREQCNAHEEEKAARDKASLRAQQSALQRQVEIANKELVATKEALEKQHQAALEGKLHEMRASEESALICAENDKQQQLADARREAVEALEVANAEHDRVLETMTQNNANELAVAVKKVRAEEKARFEKVFVQLQQEREQAEREIIDECRGAAENQMANTQLKLQEAIAKCRKQSEDKMVCRLEQAVMERNNMMKDAEQSMAMVSKERDAMEKKAEEARELLEEAEDMNFDLQRQVDALQRAGATQLLKTKLNQAKAVGAFCKFRAELTASVEEKMAASNANVQARVDHLKKDLECANQTLEAHEQQQRVFKDVLTNHKRNELMHCKMQSALIQDDLKELGKTKTTAQRQHADLGKDLAAIQGQICELEAQMQELSKVSAIQDGQINVTHAKRKRRLNQEFETLLEKASRRKEQLEAMTTKLANIDEQVQVKESNLKDLEAKVVQILVEQQKKLIALLHQQ